MEIGITPFFSDAERHKISIQGEILFPQFEKESSMIVKLFIPLIRPLVIWWAVRRSKEVQVSGRPLNSAEIELARRMGVSNPEQVRILEVSSFPFPIKLAVSGLTLGHSIYIREGYLATWLLSHELAHVTQYERFGSISAFIKEYINQVIKYGYYDMPLEVEAQKQQVSK